MEGVVTVALDNVHPIWDTLRLTGGELVALPWIGDDGQRHTTRGKVKGFAKGGQVIGIETVETGTRTLVRIHGDAAQRAYNADQDSERAARRDANRTTDAAAKYAADLAARLGIWGWQDVDAGWGGQVPTFEDFKKRDAHTTSLLIDQMKEELGIDAY